MKKFDFDIGIIGGGAAGLTVASGAAQLGAKTLLIEKEPELGGDCLHFGCVPSKTLIKTARVYHQIKHAKNYGLPEINLPPVDFKNVSSRIRSVISKIQKHDSEERFCGLGAKVLFGDASFLDPHTVKLNGNEYSSKNWVIATGSSASVAPIPGLDSTPFITNRELFYLDRLPEKLLILGGGPIGIEMAQAFSRLGSTVHVFDRADQILLKEDKDMAEGVKQVLKKEGVHFHLEVGIIETKDLGNAKEVVYTDLSGKIHHEQGDMLLVAMGRRPNIEGLGLEQAGVEFDRFGITVDKRMRTNIKHIYAAGDVAGGYQFTHAAGYEGSIVISNAIFKLPRKTNYTYLPWCTYTDPELASIGMNEIRAGEAGINYSVITENFENNDRSLAEKNRTGKVKMLLNEKEKPIGVQIFGPHAGDLISEWVAVFAAGMNLSTLAGAVHPYPTLGEINKRVAGNFLSTKIFSDTVKKGLKFFFNLKGRACDLKEDI
jgi:pyruvate/2-oxoglutarate dehydrogenase complex dihydrolipoamide dehydrogenase (E3) component